MSNFYAYARPAKAPCNQSFSKVTMIDNHFGNHVYGVEFPDGKILREEDCEFTQVPRDSDSFKKTWSEEEFAVIERMETYGGSFVKALAVCFCLADPINFIKLRTTFREYWDQYSEGGKNAK